MIIPVKVLLKTDNNEYSWEMPTSKTLKKFGITDTSGCIVPSVTFSVPGTLYPEIGVASAEHPCAGSVCVEFPYNGNKYAEHLIFYHDTKPALSHNEGQPHWNVERRPVINGEFLRRKKDIENHKIPDSPFALIEVSKPNGTIEKKEVLRPQQ